MPVVVEFTEAKCIHTGHITPSSWCVVLEQANLTLAEGFARQHDAVLAAKAFDDEGMPKCKTAAQWEKAIVSRWGVHHERRKRAAQMLQW